MNARTHLDRVLRVAGDVTARTKVDVSDLNHVLSIDVAKMRCVAEPGVTFRALVEATLAHGLAPRAVPELETITIGGAVVGWGGFHDGCVEYEIVTGEGDVVRCSREHDQELFEMMHGSYGTLGIITELTFDLVPAKRFVKMEYRASSSWRDFDAGRYARVKRRVDPKNLFRTVYEKMVRDQLPKTAREAASPSMPARKQPPTVSPKLVAAKR